MVACAYYGRGCLFWSRDGCFIYSFRLGPSWSLVPILVVGDYYGRVMLFHFHVSSGSIIVACAYYGLVMVVSFTVLIILRRNLITTRIFLVTE